MKGNKVLIPLILLVVLIISACNLVPPGSEIKVEGDFAQNPVFSPKGGIYTQDSLTISINTTEPDAVILYSFNESIPLGLDSWVYAVQALNPTQLDSCATFFMNYEDGDSLGFTELIEIGNCYQVFYDLNETLPGGAYAWMYDLDGLNKQTVNTCVDMILNVDLTSELSENTPGMSECEDVFVVLNASANDFVDTNLYEGPITIYESKTISAVVLAENMQPSDLITEKYIFDKNVDPTNVPPYVAITSPSNGVSFDKGSTINIQATASDSDGRITRVEFYRDGTVLLGTDQSAPYQYSWQNSAEGTYTLTAKAYDDAGAASLSDSVTIEVKKDNTESNIPPTVSISSPSSGAVYQDNDMVPIVANADDSDGTISKVEIIVNGNVAKTLTTFPYGYFWENPQAGQYIIGARAYDNNGASALSQAVVITVESTAGCQADSDCTGDLICDGGQCKEPDYECNIDSDCDTQGEYCASDKTCQPVPTDIINCGADIECFINAAQTCTRAKMLYQDSNDLYGIITNTGVYAELRGMQAGKCAYYQRIDSVNVEVTDERIQQMVSLGLLSQEQVEGYIKDLNDVAKENEGVEFLCSFNIEDLVLMLTRWSEGSFTGMDLTVAQCSQTHMNVDPTVYITSPASDNREYEEGDSVILDVRAEDSDGQIEKVEYFINDGNGYSSLGSLVSAPYTKIVQNLEKGVYTIYARAFDDEGGYGNSQIVVITVVEKTVSTNIFPQVSLTNPFNNDKFLTTEGISLIADATDSDGSIAKVEFMATGTTTKRLYTDTSAPYEYVWKDMNQGSYVLEAIATDDEGAQTYSQSITVDIIKPKLLLNVEPSWVVYDENETQVTCTSNLKEESEFSDMNVEIKLYRNGTLVANGTNEVSEGKVNLAQGTYEYMCSSTTYPFENVEAELMVREGITPPYIWFDFTGYDEYPDWSQYSKEDFKNLIGLRFRNKYAGVFFQGAVKILRNLDLRDDFSLKKDKVTIDSNKLPEFDVPAKIEFYNVKMIEPIPQRNGKNCSSKDCENFTYNKTRDMVSFFVDGFSKYSIIEKPYCGDDICSDDEDYQSCSADCEKPDYNSREWCVPEWECGDWNECRSDGYQIRSCVDKWSCNSIKDYPETYKRCGPSAIKTAGDLGYVAPQPNVPPVNTPSEPDVSPQPQEPYRPPEIIMIMIVVLIPLETLT